MYNLWYLDTRYGPGYSILARYNFINIIINQFINDMNTMNTNRTFIQITHYNPL